MTRRLPVVVLVLVVACTGSPSTRPEPSPLPEPTPARPAIDLPVIAPGADRSILEGMQLGAAEEGLTLDLRSGLRETLAEAPPAVLVVASLPSVVDSVTRARVAIEEARVPVIILGADLYTDRALHRYLFQTAIPLRWQARVLARYLVTDRDYERVIAWDAIAGTALREEGIEPVSPGDAADAALAVVRISSAGGSAPRLALSSEALAFSAGVSPGTVACYPYTWAGWADMLPRVHRFRVRFERAFGHPPAGFEQEGYDAVRAVAEALDRTGGLGGDALVRALESFREETYSSLPIRLGPDDHVLAEESHLGLFAVTAPGEPFASGEAHDPAPWRPIMRTFTTDGQRVNLLDRDKKVFFPAWHRRKPSPKYWKSRFGIVTRPDEDPLH